MLIGLGWILNLIGVGFMIYGGFMGEKVYTSGAFGFSSSVTVAHLPSLILGGVLLIIGVMMVLTNAVLDAISESNAIDSPVQTKS